MGKFYSILKHVHVEDLKGNLKLNSTRDIVRFGNSSKLKVCSVIFVSLFEVGLLQSKSIFFLPPLKGEKKKSFSGFIAYSRGGHVLAEGGKLTDGLQLF